MKKIIAVFFALSLLFPHLAWAQRAELIVLPTRIVMENNDRYTTVTVKNSGQATGNFSVEVSDMTMQEDGMVVPLAEGQKDEFSAIPYLRIAPRSMTLKPGEIQNVRVMLRKPEGLAAGEYRSHLSVKIDNDNVEASEKKEAETTNDAKIELKARLVLIIPVIFRHGETSVSMKMEAPKITKDANGKSQLEIDLLRDGNRSSMGDFTVSYIADNGKAELVKFYPGLPVYRSTPKRHVVIPLDETPANVDMTKGKLKISYNAQENEEKKLLAESELNLSAQ